MGSPTKSAPLTIWAVALDFECKRETALELGAVAEAVSAGKNVWLDVEVHDVERARPLLRELGLVGQEALEDALVNEPLTRIARFDDYVHLVLAGCQPNATSFDLSRADVFIGRHFVFTLRRSAVPFLTNVRRDYRADFERYAQSLSFLMYEIWDHLIDHYLRVQKAMEERVEALQHELASAKLDDSVFQRISQLGADLLHFRKILLPARAVLGDLSSRRTIFLSEATQQFLGNMVGTIEHVLQDLLVDREILSESLNLYVSMVSHRTNEVMKRLTVVSVIFLPLTFLVGVYGMNFEVLPELRWHYGYAYFWLAAVTIVLGLLWLLRKNRVL